MPHTGELGDDEAMRRFCAGDQRAFELLYERYRSAVWKYCVASTRTDADDVFQTIWLAVIKGADSYRGQGKFTHWLFTLARNEVIDHSRKRPLIQAENIEPDSIQAPSDGQPDAETIRSISATILIQAIHHLPLPQRETLLLKVISNMSYAEIAKATGVSIETVKSRLRYARARLPHLIKNLELS